MCIRDRSGLYPTSVAAEGQGQAAAIKKRVKSTSKGKTKTVKVGANAKVKSKSLMIFTRQLATLIDSGLPLLRGLTVLGRQEPNLITVSYTHLDVYKRQAIPSSRCTGYNLWQRSRGNSSQSLSCRWLRR